MTVSIPVTQAMLLFIPDTFGTTPYKTMSNSRGVNRHYTYFEVLSMPIMATKFTFTKWMVE